MTWVRNYLLGVGLGLCLLAAAWRLDHDPRTVEDFVQRIDTATIRRPAPEVFSVADVPIGGIAKSSIRVEHPSRIAWDVMVPRHAWVEADLALQEAAWNAPGDGVVFRVGVSHANVYTELLAQVVNPFEQPADRRWVPIAVDLTPYAGRRVSLIFNTRAGLSGDNRTNDLAVWGALRLVTR
ncbi:MAG: hypothetical protein ABIP90_05555 [Vicinamibacterales bacterium]